MKDNFIKFLKSLIDSENLFWSVDVHGPDSSMLLSSSVQVTMRMSYQ